MQPKRWGVANIGTDWGDIIYDARNLDPLTIHFPVGSSWVVLYNPPFSSREIFTYNSFFIVVIIIIFFSLLCFYFVSFTFFLIFAYLRSNKTWVSEHFSLLSRNELLLLEHFLFYFNAFIFSCFTNFDSHYHY